MQMPCQAVLLQVSENSMFIEERSFASCAGEGQPDPAAGTTGALLYNRKMVRTRGTRSSRGSRAYIAAPSIGSNTY